MQCDVLMSSTGLFFKVASFIDATFNYLQVCVLAVTVFLCIHLACGVFPRCLRVVFGPCGLPFWSVLRLVWTCRKSRTSQRKFVEFAIVRTSGRFLDKKRWGDVVGEFATLMRSSSSFEQEMHVRNCMTLAAPAFNDAVGRYFGYLDRPAVRTFYSISRNDGLWLSPVKIDEAYLTPTKLLTGLLSRYNENWEAFLARYSSVLAMGSKGDSRVLPQEIYNTFAWLLWGPSREVGWQNGWDGLCQLSYGDESNSVPAFLAQSGGMIDKLRGTLERRSHEGAWGVEVSAKAIFKPKQAFFRKERSSMLPSNAYFIDNIANDPDSTFVVCLSDVEERLGFRSQSYYCTAYLWILFELENGDGAFRPENAVAFFEHSNIASKTTSEFLARSLFNKAILHFRSIFEDETLRKRRYRFVCGFNSVLEEKCRQRFAEEVDNGGPFSQWLSSAVSFDGGHEPDEVFSALDVFFDDGGDMCSYCDLDAESRKDMADLALFYAGMYSESFAADDERESLDNIVKYLKESQAYREWAFHVLLAKDESGGIVGGAVFDYFRKSNSTAVEFLVVDSKFRGRGLGTRLFRQIVKIADEDARKAGNTSCELVLCEVESPETSSDKTLMHLHFWGGNWMRRLDFSYVQPPLAIGKHPVEGLWLLAKSRDNSAASIPADTLKAFLRDYVHYSMKESGTVGAEILSAMEREVANKGRVKLVSLFA